MANQTLIGSNADDTLTDVPTSPGDDLFRGLAADDSLISSVGRDTLDGDTGFDTADFSLRTGNVVVSLLTGQEANSLSTLINIEAVKGSAFGDSLFGDGNANWLGGGAGDDVIDGGAGDDTVEGGAGDNDLTGGAGFDLASYATATGAVTASLAAGTATGPVNDILTGFEGLVGSAFNDTLTGNGQKNLLNIGTGGADSVSGGGGFDTISFADLTTSANVDMVARLEFNTLTSFTGIEGVIGTGFGDSILGDTAGNWLSGGAGDDVIDGGAGDDTVEGGAGDDDLAGGSGFDLASFATATGAVTASLATNRATGQGSDTLAGFEGLIGSAFADTLTGDSGRNLLNIGSGGADSVAGGAGFDTISFADLTQSVIVDLAARREFNTLTSFTGIEAVIGTAFGDSIAGDTVGNFLSGGAGDDVIDGGLGNDTIQGGAGDDSLDGGGGTDLVSYVNATGGVAVNLVSGITSGAENDTLSGFENINGSAFSDTLIGSAVANVLNVGAGGADSVSGGAGFDTLSFADLTQSANVDMVARREFNTLTSFTGIEAVIGTAFGDSIAGDTVGNFLSGGAGDDVVSGGAGNDTIAGGVGDDSLDGGVGLDTLTYAQSSGPVSVNLATGLATGDGADTVTGFESVIGTAGNDTLIGDGVSNLLNVGAGGVDSVVGGGGGFDTISFANVSGSVNVSLVDGREFNSLTSFTGIDAVVGSAGSDSLLGDGQANWLGGGDGDDAIVADAGNDTLSGGLGDDNLDGGAGFDIVSYVSATNGVTVNLASGQATGEGTDVLTAVEGVIGSRFNDSLVGNAANNLLNIGSGGRDSVVGGTGFDTVSFANLGSGVNVNMVSGTEASTLTTFTGVEAVAGTAFRDTILGNSSGNWLGGGAGDDVIDGGAGNDTIAGALGNDSLVGGLGFDVVSYASATNAVSVNINSGVATGQGNDTVVGFEGIVGTAFSDTMVGNAVSNLFNVGAGGADTVTGGLGFDTISFIDRPTGIVASLVTGIETVSGTSFAEIEAINGTNAADSITGDSNANFFSGNAGNDTILGGDGRDTINGGAGDDSLDGGTGFDIASFANAAAAVTADLSTQSATGDGNDVLIAFEALTGSSFGDVLIGDAANNSLNGGGGADTLTGNGGADSFAFAAGLANGDLVTDFSGIGGDNDRLVLQGYGVGATFTSLGSGQYQIANATSTIVDIITVTGTVAVGDWVFV